MGEHGPLEESVGRAVQEAKKACYATMALEVLESAGALLVRHLDLLSHHKREYVAAGDEDAANAALSLEELVRGVLAEARMWACLKKDRAHEAWESIVLAEMHLRLAIQCHARARDLGASESYERSLLLQEVLFPTVHFVSPGSKVRRSTCSICGSIYGECDHLPGQPYFGEFCVRLIEEADLLEVSSVEQPASKLNRVVEISDEDGTVDLFTGKLLDATPSSVFKFRAIIR